ncbi:MAG TPA: hypothetical protein VIH61_02950, partial [Waddliaceae bacterium]
MYSLNPSFSTISDVATIDAVCAKYGLDPIGSVHRKAKNDKLYAEYGLDPVVNPYSGSSVTTVDKEGFFSFVREAFENLKKNICSKIPSEVAEAVTLITSVGTDIIILCDFIVAITLPILKTITNATVAVNDYFDNHFLENFIRNTRLFSIISVPASLCELVENIRKLANALFDGVIRKIILKGSAVLSNLSDISMAVAAFLDGLVALGRLTSKVAGVASHSLNVIAVVFSLPTIVL